MSDKVKTSKDSEDKDKVHAEIVSELDKKRDVSVLYNYDPEDIVETLYQLTLLRLDRKYNGMLTKKHEVHVANATSLSRDYDAQIMNISGVKELKEEYEDKISKQKAALEKEYHEKIARIPGVLELYEARDAEILKIKQLFNREKIQLQTDLDQAKDLVSKGDTIVKGPMNKWLNTKRQEILDCLDILNGQKSESESQDRDVAKEVESKKPDTGDNKKTEDKMTSEAKEEKADKPAVDSVEVPASTNEGKPVERAEADMPTITDEVKPAEEVKVDTPAATDEAKPAEEVKVDMPAATDEAKTAEEVKVDTPASTDEDKPVEGAEADVPASTDEANPAIDNAEVLTTTDEAATMGNTALDSQGDL